MASTGAVARDYGHNMGSYIVIGRPKSDQMVDKSQRFFCPLQLTYEVDTSETTMPLMLPFHFEGTKLVNKTSISNAGQNPKNNLCSYLGRKHTRPSFWPKLRNGYPIQTVEMGESVSKLNLYKIYGKTDSIFQYYGTTIIVLSGCYE